eukprot:1145757-Pelagomonas_calceolata.AAC.9
MERNPLWQPSRPVTERVLGDPLELELLRASFKHDDCKVKPSYLGRWEAPFSLTSCHLAAGLLDEVPLTLGTDCIVLQSPCSPRPWVLPHHMESTSMPSCCAAAAAAAQAGH